MANNLFRILDANYNRAKEALRVLEDLYRFKKNSAKLSAHLKRLRHSISKQLLSLPVAYEKLLAARDSGADVGRRRRIQDRNRRPETRDLITANFKRSQESLRVLEEVLKTMDLRQSDKMRHFRFQLYALEKEAFRKL